MLSVCFTKTQIFFRELRSPPDEYIEFSNSNTCTIDLKPLNNVDLLKVVKQRWEVSLIPADVGTKILSAACGNPLYAIEVSNTLKDRGVVSIENGKVVVHCEVSSVVIPDSLSALITASLDRLHPHQQMILRIASVLGKTAKREMLCEVFRGTVDITDSSSGDVETEVDDLIQKGVLMVHGKKLKCSNAMFLEVAYSKMLFAQRRRLHASIAEYYEHNHSEDMYKFYHVIRHHYEKAERHDLSLKYQKKMEARKRWRTVTKMVTALAFTRRCSKQKQVE